MTLKKILNLLLNTLNLIRKSEDVGDEKVKLGGIL